MSRDFTKIFYGIGVLFLIIVFTILVFSVDFFFKADDFQIKSSFNALNNGHWYRPLSTFINGLLGNNHIIHNIFSYLLHLVNGLVFYLFFKEFDRQLKLRINNLLIFLSVVLLISIPSSSETIFWTTCKGIILSSITALGSLIFYFKYETALKKIYLILSLLFYFISVLFYESTVFIPFIIIVFSYLKENNIKKLREKYFLLLYFIPLNALIFYYYFKSNFFFNYGLVRPFNTEFIRIISGFIQVPIRSILPFISKTYFIILSVSLIVLIISAAIKHKKSANSVFLALTINVIIMSIPVVLFGLSYNSPVGERLLYTVSPFTIIIIIYLISKIKATNNFKSLIVIFLLSINLFGFIAANKQWKKASEISENFTKDLIKLKPCNNLVIIALPDNYKNRLIIKPNNLKHINVFLAKKKNYNKMHVLTSYQLEKKCFFNNNDMQSFHFQNSNFSIYTNNLEKLNIDYSVKNNKIFYTFPKELLNEKNCIYKGSNFCN